MTKPKETPMNKILTHTLLHVHIRLCNDVYDGELPMTPHEWEDNQHQRTHFDKPRLLCYIRS